MIIEEGNFEEVKNFEAHEVSVIKAHAEIALDKEKKLAQIAFYSAIAKMQGELQAVVKDKKAKGGQSANGKAFAGYAYADLASCREVAREPLANNGLSVIDKLTSKAGGGYMLETMLLHESGESISSIYDVIEINMSGNAAQSLGASLTYMKRYAFCSLVGLATEDNDAQSFNTLDRGMNKNYNNKTEQSQALEAEHNQDVMKLNTYLENYNNYYGDPLEFCSKVVKREIKDFSQIKPNDLILINKEIKSMQEIEEKKAKAKEKENKKTAF